PFALTTGPDLFRPERANSRGWDLTAAPDLAAIEAARQPFGIEHFEAAPLLAVPAQGGAAVDALNPARPGERVGRVTQASRADV
ncbi:hypothetical protein JI667_22415, partial [Bacillus sp. NTK074B]|nr:hypothetical protein [Bacillus sp. NTK074B]